MAKENNRLHQNSNKSILSKSHVAHPSMENVYKLNHGLHYLLQLSILAHILALKHFFYSEGMEL